MQPENLLLMDSECKEVQELPPQLLNRQGTKENPKHSRYILPKNDQIKVIDFGGATFSGEYKSKVINTRQYRAPEVILRNGQGWLRSRVHGMERKV